MLKKKMAIRLFVCFFEEKNYVKSLILIFCANYSQPRDLKLDFLFRLGKTSDGCTVNAKDQGTIQLRGLQFYSAFRLWY